MAVYIAISAVMRTKASAALRMSASADRAYFEASAGRHPGVAAVYAEELSFLGQYMYVEKKSLCLNSYVHFGCDTEAIRESDRPTPIVGHYAIDGSTDGNTNV